MSVSGEYKGKIVHIGDTEQISDNFKKREFVVEVVNERNTDWNDFIKAQLTQDRCLVLDNFQLGDEVNVSYNLRGRKYEKEGDTRYFVNIESWRVEKIDTAEAPSDAEDKKASDLGEADLSPEEDDDMPF